MFGCIFENTLENTFSTSFSYSPNFQTNIIIENSNINPKKQEREREREREREVHSRSMIRFGGDEDKLEAEMTRLVVRSKGSNEISLGGWS